MFRQNRVLLCRAAPDTPHGGGGARSGYCGAVLLIEKIPRIGYIKPDQPGAFR
jgi:hypothetical protein